MAYPSLPTKLPRSLYRFFWDVDPKKVDPSVNTYYVINRLLDKGNLEAARWVVHTFPNDEIVKTFKTRRDFSFPTAVFWTTYLKIPREEVRCLQEPYYNLRKTLWPY